MKDITPVFSKLLRYINNGYKKDNNYDIAKAMLDHFEEISNLTIYELADLCYVSPASISRFIRTLGFDNYSDFKKECKSTMSIDVDYSKAVNKATKEDIEPIFQRYTNNIIENLQFTLDKLDYEQLERIANKLYNTNDIALFGLEFANILGQHFQIKMASMNKFVKIGMTYEEQIEIAESLKDGAVVLIMSLEGGYFYRSDKVMEILKKKDITIVAFSMNDNLKPAKDVDELIICNKYNSDTEGRLTILYIMELILMYYCINYQGISR